MEASETEFFENDTGGWDMQTLYFSETLGGGANTLQISDPNSAGRTRLPELKHHMLTFSSRYISWTD